MTEQDLSTSRKAKNSNIVTLHPAQNGRNGQYGKPLQIKFIEKHWECKCGPMRTAVAGPGQNRGRKYYSCPKKSVDITRCGAFTFADNEDVQRVEGSPTDGSGRRQTKIADWIPRPPQQPAAAGTSGQPSQPSQPSHPASTAPDSRTRHVQHFPVQAGPSTARPSFTIHKDLAAPTSTSPVAHGKQPVRPQNHASANRGHPQTIVEPVPSVDIDNASDGGDFSDWSEGTKDLLLEMAETIQKINGPFKGPLPEPISPSLIASSRMTTPRAAPAKRSARRISPAAAPAVVPSGYGSWIQTQSSVSESLQSPPSAPPPRETCASSQRPTMPKPKERRAARDSPDFTWTPDQQLQEELNAPSPTVPIPTPSRAPRRQASPSPAASHSSGSRYSDSSPSLDPNEYEMYSNEDDRYPMDFDSENDSCGTARRGKRGRRHEGVGAYPMAHSRTPRRLTSAKASAACGLPTPGDTRPNGEEGVSRFRDVEAQAGVLPPLNFGQVASKSRSSRGRSNEGNGADLFGSPKKKRRAPTSTSTSASTYTSSPARALALAPASFQSRKSPSPPSPELAPEKLARKISSLVASCSDPSSERVQDKILSITSRHLKHVRKEYERSRKRQARIHEQQLRKKDEMIRKLQEDLQRVEDEKKALADSERELRDCRESIKFKTVELFDVLR